MADYSLHSPTIAVRDSYGCSVLVMVEKITVTVTITITVTATVVVTVAATVTSTVAITGR